MRWVEFVPQYGGKVRIALNKIMALHENNPNFECKVVGREYVGPITYIEYGPASAEDGTGTVVRGSLDEVQAMIDKAEGLDFPVANSGPLGIDPNALSALRHNQRQLDMEGSEVGVSRQALEEVLNAIGDN